MGGDGGMDQGAVGKREDDVLGCVWKVELVGLVGLGVGSEADRETKDDSQVSSLSYWMGGSAFNRHRKLSEGNKGHTTKAKGNMKVGNP